HPEQAALDDPALAPGHAFGLPSSTYLRAERPVGVKRRRGIASAFPGIDLEEPLTEKPRCAHQEMRRAARDIDDPQTLDVCCRSLPNKRLEGRVHKIVDHGGGCIVGPARLSGGSRFEEEGARLQS